MKPPQLHRVAEIDRQLVEIEIDGWQLSAMVGDTVQRSRPCQKAQAGSGHQSPS